MTLVNIDAHSDMAMFDGGLGIGNFISKLVDLRIVDEVVWVKNPMSMDFERGVYKFAVGRRDNTQHLAVSLPTPFFFLQNSYLPADDLIEPKVITMVVEDRLEDFTPQSNKKWILSVDYDYFGARNPHFEVLAKLVGSIGPETFKTLYTRGRSITTAREWESFRKPLEEMAPGLLANMATSILPHYTEDVGSKVVEVARFIEGNFKWKDCVGVYTVSSLSSGFTDPEKHDEIATKVAEWLTRAGANKSKNPAAK